MCIKPFHLEQITYHWFQPLPLKQPCRVIWWEFQISLFRSGFSSENWSRSKLNHPICSRSPILDFSHSYWNSHTGWSGGNFKFPSSDLDSPWKKSPGTSQTIPFGECCPTSPGAPIIVLGVAGVLGWIKQFVARFMISLKNGFRYKLNHSNWRVPLPKLLGFCEYFAFFSPIRKALIMRPPGSESSQNEAPDHTRIIPIGPHPTCPKITPLLIDLIARNIMPQYIPLFIEGWILLGYIVTLVLGSLH